MSNKTLNVAVIGAGFMGETHLASWMLVQGAKPVAVVDIVAERARALASRYNIEAYDDIEKVLRRPDIDAVDICTPTETHVVQIERAVEAGKHVLVEKPLALDMKSGERAASIAEKGGVKVMVAHVLRYFSEYRKAKELVDNGALGEVRQVRSSRRGSPPRWTDWYLDEKRSGGVSLDLVIHDIDFLRWCLEDEAERVYAVESRSGENGSAADHAFILLKFKRGVIAQAEASWAQPPTAPFTMILEMFGTRGMLKYDNRENVPVVMTKNAGVSTFSPDRLPLSPTKMPFPIDPYYREIEDFARCILEDREPPVLVSDAIKSLKVCLAAKESARRGEPVSL
ncbi:MAG: Gfo/Idh/MocA family oxidoreductase [Nitrososphaerota archaeon]|nr:Gfo/Idh/MocA family oxidoreductase [Candidatus Calditenuaceae archaeon]MDW8072719.1 Gfo/Idh/MocA family oxidoreductase [Nitrososphaerota archaeon]